MYNGEPTLTDYFGFKDIFFANPKSAILIVLSFINILAGFKSLCKNPD
jgi:hypothetical protein